MIKTLSVGLTDDSKINYVTFNFHSMCEMDYFCEDLASYIIDKYSNYFLGIIINRNYGYFNKSDKAEIYKIAKTTFSNIYSDGFLYQRYSIKEKIYNYFADEQADTIILEGFARFRLGGYLDELELMVDCAVHEYIVNQEYEGFISMLQEFVALQKPLAQLIHVRSEKDGRYFIYDENFEELTQSHILGFAGDDMKEFINEDDFLLSALISIAPKKIMIHQRENIKNKQLFETLAKVFGNRMVECAGCDLCSR